MISYNSSFHYRGIETKGKLGLVSIWVSIDDHNYIHDEREIWKFSFPKQYLKGKHNKNCCLHFYSTKNLKSPSPWPRAPFASITKTLEPMNKIPNSSIYLVPGTSSFGTKDYDNVLISMGGKIRTTTEKILHMLK